MATATPTTTPAPVGIPDPLVGQQTGTESSLSNWAGDYVTNMLGKGQALSETPYQAYTGPLTAGASGLQTQAFNTAADLQVPASMQGAPGIAGNIVNQFLGSSYNPSQFGNQFTAPALSAQTNFTNQYTAPTLSAETQFANQYKAPTAYQDGQFSTDTFGTRQAQQYMNPYLQSALNPQLDEARRQAQISRMGDAARLSQAGAYGGSRQAIMESELNRNLMAKQADITGIGYNTAYDKAAQQFNADQARQAGVQQATEQSRQFGYGQGMNAAQLQAQFGLSAQQAQEAARQFNQGQQQTSAQQQAQYGLSALQGQEAGRQFNQGQGMTGAQFGAQYGLAGQQAGEQSKQFGANYGLQNLQGALAGAQAQGALGNQLNQANLANLGMQSNLGGVQRGIEGEGIAADYGQFKEERDYPFKQVQYQQSLLQGMPLAAQSYSYQEPSTLSTVMGSAGGVKALYDSLFGPK